MWSKKDEFFQKRRCIKCGEIEILTSLRAVSDHEEKESEIEKFIKGYVKYYDLKIEYKNKDEEELRIIFEELLEKEKDIERKLDGRMPPRK